MHDCADGGPQNTHLYVNCSSIFIHSVIPIYNTLSVMRCITPLVDMIYKCINIHTHCVRDMINSTDIFAPCNYTFCLRFRSSFLLLKAKHFKTDELKSSPQLVSYAQAHTQLVWTKMTFGFRTFLDFTFNLYFM